MGSEMMMMKKSNFARTCNRFSQFLKERRSHLAASVAVASPRHPDLSLLYPVVHNCMETETDTDTDRRSLELFPLTSSSTANSSEQPATTNLNDFSSETSIMNDERKKTTPSMTIIYDGKVVVVDELSEDMAQEIMSLAGSGAVIAPQQHKTTPSQTNNDNNTITTNFVQGLSDLPIARRVSLHRFMAKRKERIAGNAPYQVQSSMSSAQGHPQKYSSMKKSYKQHEEQQLELKL